MAEVPEGALPPRREDVFRHLADLAAGSFEGAESPTDRLSLFRRSVELLDPVVTASLRWTNETFFLGTGEVARVDVEPDGAGGHRAGWTLSWPEQRSATSRFGGPVGPIQVWARFLQGFTHPHLGGEKAGSWSMQVTSEGDARRQAVVVGAIVEAELHERIFEGRLGIVPAFDAGTPSR
jgi:hypothetical protein